MDTQTFRTITEKINIYVSDTFLSHFMRKLYKPIYNLLAFFLMKLPRTESTKLNLFMFIVIGVRPAKLSSSKMLCNHVLSHHKVENRVKIFHSALQPSVKPP